MPIDAAAEIAHSIELRIPRPAWALARESSTTLAAGIPGLLLAPHHQLAPRAVERQWIRRTSSPWRYSRTRTSS